MGLLRRARRTDLAGRGEAPGEAGTPCPRPAKKAPETVAFAPPVGLSAPALSLLGGYSSRLRGKAAPSASRCPPVPVAAQHPEDTNPAASRSGSRLEKRRGSWMQSLFLCCSGWFLNHGALSAEASESCLFGVSFFVIIPFLKGHPQQTEAHAHNH